jgi:DNA repair exonuclease SbcCD ATPase subunit
LRTSIIGSTLLCLAASPAGAQPARAPVSPATAEVRSSTASSWCEFIRGVTDAETAVLLAPEVFASTGVVNAGEATSGAGDAPLGAPKLRITAGLGYELVGVYRGMTLRRRAEAECHRHQALQALQAVLESGPDTSAGPALKARLAALEAALPEGERLVEALRTDVRDGRATLEELNALQLRLDELRALATDTRRAQERLARLPPRPERPLSALLEELRNAEDELERLSGKVRRSTAWSITLRGGYDELVDVPQDLPLFGMLTVSYKLGGLSQSAANERARAARLKALGEDVEGLPQRVERLIDQLRATRSAEETRLREVTVLVSDLESQLQSIQSLETVKIRRFHDYVILELARLRAEQAWLRAHLEALSSLLEKEVP